MKALSASENMLKVVFSDDYDFVIPRYQRPYAWTQEHALELFDDLYEHFQATRNLADAEKLPYFLGSVVLIKNENAPLAEVIDGQQRLTTLTILFAAMRDQARDGKLRAEFQTLYQSEAQKLKKIAAKPRLTLRECDQAFFHERVQATDDFSAIQTLISSELKTESQKRIYENSLALLSRIQRLLPTDEELSDFGEFLLNRCFLAVVSTPTQESAFRVFAVLNNRGLDLLPCDVLKSEIIGRIDAESQEKYANAWERFERSLGRKTFNELFGHILSIYYPNRTQGKLLEHFRGRLLKDVATPEATRRFFDDVISPCAEYFRDLKRGILRLDNKSNAVFSPFATELNALSQVEFSDWVPVALAFLLRCREEKSAPTDLARFFRKLERLTSYLYLCSKDVKKRGERFASVLKDLQEVDGDAWQESIELTPTEQREFLETLDGPVYELPTSNRRRFLLLRLDSFIAETGAVYDAKIATVEHVLPQKPTSEYWQNRWSEEERSTWLHRVGNLVPLSGRKNSKAQNFDFPKKRDAYFLNDAKTSPYALTAQLLAETDWTPAIVATRQKRLLTAFAKHWKLVGCDAPQEKVVSDVSGDAQSQLAAQNFRLDFWSRFSAKLLAATDLKSTQTPSADRSFDVRLGASGVALSARCRFLQREIELRLYLTSGKKALYLPALEANRATLEKLAGRPLDFAPTAPGKDQVIVLKTFDVEPGDAASVETILERLTEATAAFRQTLRPLVAKQAENVKSISVWTLESRPFYNDCRKLFEEFRTEIVRRFPDIRQDVRKLYVAFSAQKSVVDVEFQKKGLRLHVNLKFPEVVDPDGVCLDLTGKGHWGSGDVGVYVRNRADVDKALRIVEQSYRKNS